MALMQLPHVARGDALKETNFPLLKLRNAAVLEVRQGPPVPFRDLGRLKGTYLCVTFHTRRLYGLNKIKGGFMKTLRLTIFLVMACTLVLLASQSAFGAIKIVQFAVPSCE